MKKTSFIKKIAAGALSMALLLSLGACAKKDTPSPDGPTSVSVTEIPGGTAETSGITYKIGICNYVDDASLNQIVDNIQSQLQAIGEEKGVSFNVSYDNCNADAAVMNHRRCHPSRHDHAVGNRGQWDSRGLLSGFRPSKRRIGCVP